MLSAWGSSNVRLRTLLRRAEKLCFSGRSYPTSAAPPPCQRGAAEPQRIEARRKSEAFPLGNTEKHGPTRKTSVHIRVHPWLKIQGLNPLHRGGVESPVRLERLGVEWAAGSAVEAGLVSDALLHEGAAEVLVR